MPYFLIRSRPNGLHWQTSRGFTTSDPKDGTKYSSEAEALMVVAGCCPAKARAEVVRGGTVEP